MWAAAPWASTPWAAVPEEAPSAITGSLSGTLGALTSSATGTLAIAGTLTQTLGAATLSATGTVSQPSITGSLSATLGELTLVAYENEQTTQRGGGHAYLRNGFVQARKRLALQRALDFLTQPEPEEETKQIIREIKAGKPVKQDKKPPVVMREVSAEKLADKLIPSRIAQLPPDIDLQQVIRRAIEIAQERDDEETLMLLL